LKGGRRGDKGTLKKHTERKKREREREKRENDTLRRKKTSMFPLKIGF